MDVADLEGQTYADFMSDPTAVYRYYAAYERVQREVCCLECFAEVEVVEARRLGRPDPFPVFERTLRSHDAAFDALRDVVVTSPVAWLEAAFAPGQPAVSVRPGAYTYPARIDACGLRTADQEVITSRVAAFLATTPKNQLIVRFYEREEVVIDGARRWKLPEQLIREVRFHC